jgi:hypothetical protein
MEGQKTCGDCAMLLDIDEDGEGYCALLDLFTYRNRDEIACDDNFIEKTDKENVSRETFKE